MKIRYIFLIAFITIANLAFSQCNEVARSSQQYFGDKFISDGQTYRALLFEDQVAEFTTLFFGGATYRISANTGTDKGIIFNVLDEKRNVIFSSADYEKSPYWDFVVENTLNCTIEAHLDPAVQNSGCAVILIGFKE
jgi:hypothetical protein